MSLTYLRAPGRSRSSALARLSLTLAASAQHAHLDLRTAKAVPIPRPFTLSEATIHARRLPRGVYVYRAASCPTAETRPETSRLDVFTFQRTHPYEHYMLLSEKPLRFRKIEEPVQPAPYWHVLVRD